MLTSITPFGERGRGQRWWLTATWLTIGHGAGGLVLGLALVVLAAGRNEIGGAVSADVQLWSIAVAAVAAAIFDLSGGRLPGRRQVDERWLTTYRGWVYGVGFGFQLGLGFVTVVNTALFLVVIGAGVIIGGQQALWLGGLYGAVRAVMALLNARVRTVEELKVLHRRLDGIGPALRVGGGILTGVSATVAVMVA
ncbi:MAG: hypothetical protein AAGC53_07570 [Actinomycetota bacterium]